MFSTDYTNDYSNEYFSGLGRDFASYNYNAEQNYGAEQEQYGYSGGGPDSQHYGYESETREAGNAGFNADGIYVENESDFLTDTSQRGYDNSSTQNFDFGGDSSGVSPYFGIDPVENAPEEEEPEDLKTSAFMPGPWKPAAGQRESDINSLTRDAQIVAGIRPDEEPGKELPDVAQEIEVTVPSELLGEDMCKLCFVSFTSLDMAGAHYAGKKHAQRENQYVRKIYEAKGINVTRFVNKALTHITTKHLQAKRAEQKKRRFRFACRLCHLSFVNQAEVDEHVSKPAHQDKVNEYQLRYTASGGPIRGGASRPWGGHRRGGSAQPSTGVLHCSLCNKSMNSQQQWDLHVNSKKHLSKATYM